METALTTISIRRDAERYASLLTPEALTFLEQLHLKFNTSRKVLLEKRRQQQLEFDRGATPKFPTETSAIRTGTWTAAPIPEKLQDRRVEITGPVDAKMIINALNSGASMFMADFEDSCAPTWENLMEGQLNLYAALRKTLRLETPNKTYELGPKTATLLVRPRGLHLEEKNLYYGEERLSASLVDFGLFVFHNAQYAYQHEEGPFFYIPKLEHYLEARWWNEVFVFAQQYLQIPTGTFKATVLIETITASFQLDEIIYELRDHIAGLNCGRWDYIFSYIKKLKTHDQFLVPDRDQVTMTSPFMQAYALRVIQVCHKRNILAIGGMAAQIPIKNDEEANAIAIQKVITDKEREVRNGHDGTWVAHPGLVAPVLKVFNTHMPTKNHLHIKRNELQITEGMLIELPQGTITENGVRKNIHVGILYLESWLMGTGAAALYHLMEDAATAEISRVQLWHWRNKEIVLENKEICSTSYYQKLVQEELEKIKISIGDSRYESGRFALASSLFFKMITADELAEFLTLEAYEFLE